MNTHILLASPQMQMVAEAVATHEPRIMVGRVSWKRFPDGMPNLFIHGVDTVQNAHVSFLMCLDDPDTIFEQMSLLYALAVLAPKSLKILLPYFPTGTMERIDHEGQVATAATLAQMISAIAPAGPGPVPLYLWDIHALPIRHYFGPNISPKFKTGTKLLKEHLAGENVSIAFPDEGAWKRFKMMFSDEHGTPLFPLIGIENGIRENGTGWEDVALVVILCPDGKEIRAESVALPFPADAVAKAAARGFVTTTVGQILAEHHGADANDPHHFLTNGRTSRTALLTETLLRALAQSLTPSH